MRATNSLIIFDALPLTPNTPTNRLGRSPILWRDSTLQMLRDRLLDSEIAL